MGKKKDKKREKRDYFGARYKTGDVGDLMRRYDVEGTNSVMPSARNSYNEERTYDDVQSDIAKAMMNDYDTRRTFEAAAMAGNKDAKKFARKGIKDGKIFEAYDVMKDLKKEYVGGGGMRGAKNEAGLTQALVEADRGKLLDDLKDKAEKATPDPIAPAPPEAQFSITEDEDFAQDEARDKRIDEYETKRAFTGLVGDEDTQDYMDKYKFNVAKGLSDAGIDTRGPSAPSFIL